MPNCHVWVECEQNNRKDSLSEYGPVSSKLILGEAVYVMWPPERATSLRDLIKCEPFMRKKPPDYSEVLEASEINFRYGI